jgi:hypothetical protein
VRRLLLSLFSSAAVMFLCVSQSVSQETKLLKETEAQVAKDYISLGKDAEKSPLIQKQEIKATPQTIPLTSICVKGTSLYTIDSQKGVRAIDLAKPETVTKYESVKGCAIARDDKNFWIAQKEEKKIICVEDISTGKTKSTLPLPCAEPFALAREGNLLFVADKAQKKIYHLNSETGKGTGETPLPSDTISSLSCRSGYFWLADSKNKALYMGDKQGRILINLPLQFSPGAITWDGNSLYLINSETNSIVRFEVNENQKYTISSRREATVKFSVKAGGDCYIALPWRLNMQEILSKIEFSPSAEIVEDKWEQKAAKFNPENGKAELKVRAAVYSIRYHIFPEKVGSFDDIPKKIKYIYTVDGAMLKLSDPIIQEAAKEVFALIEKEKREKNPYWVARLAYDVTIKKVHYERGVPWADAPTTIKRGKGLCSPITFVYMAICRACGLPARFQAGTRYPGKDPSTDAEFHRWAEVYLPNYGWVPIDPSATGANPLPTVAANYFGFIPNDLLIMTLGGGDSEIFGWNYHAAPEGADRSAEWSKVVTK